MHIFLVIYTDFVLDHSGRSDFKQSIVESKDLFESLNKSY